jgi:arylsulfatase A-like enzyme
MRLNDGEIDPAGHATDLFTQWAIDYIRERTKSERRFFLYLAYNAPHTPIQPPQEWVERVERREKGIDAKRAKLVALIEHLDDGIGKVIGALKACGVYERTLIVFTSDNGGQLSVGANNGPLNGGKVMMYEGGIRVPMCAVWPGKIEPGSRSERVAMTMDLFPTICEAAGVRINHEIDGQSILPMLVGGGQEAEERFLFWVLREGGGYWGHEYWGQDRYAVRYGDWKLLQNSPFEPLRLFNLKDDPGEQNPLGAKHKMHRHLLGALQDHILETGAVPWQKHPVKLPTSG